MKSFFLIYSSYLLSFRQSFCIRLLCCLLISLIFNISSSFAQGNEQLLKRCWTPEQLKASKNETRAKRSRHGVNPPSYKSQYSVHSRSTLTNRSFKRGTVRWVKLPKGEKLIALTLDLCEAAFEISGYDGDVIDYLRANKIKATLFIGGKWMDHHNERVQQLIADPLFEIGSHSWSHMNLRKLHGKALVREISSVQGAYERAYTALSKRLCFNPSLVNSFLSTQTSSGYKASLSPIPNKLSLFRFPFGTCHKQALEEVYKHGQLPIQWNVVTGDPAFGQSARRIASIIKQRVKPGSIIIAHANGRGRNTARALPLFIPDLKKQGYIFVTVSELLAAGEPQVSTTCYENRPGDNSHY